MLKAVNQAFLIHGEMVKIGVSIGIALYPTDRAETELLIKSADDARYPAKQRGKNQMVFTFE